MIGGSEAFIGIMRRRGTREEIVCGLVFLALDESSYMDGTELVIGRCKLSGTVAVGGHALRCAAVIAPS